jgi:DNA-directed RNA polymerase subunit alpha
LVSRSREDLLEVRNFGETTLQEIEAKLRELGLELGMSLPAGAGA